MAKSKRSDKAERSLEEIFAEDLKEARSLLFDLRAVMPPEMLVSAELCRLIEGEKAVVRILSEMAGAVVGDLRPIEEPELDQIFARLQSAVPNAPSVRRAFRELSLERTNTVDLEGSEARRP